MQAQSAPFAKTPRGPHFKVKPKAMKYDNCLKLISFFFRVWNSYTNQFKDILNRLYDSVNT